MVDVTTRTLRDFIASLPNGGIAGLVDANLTIRNDVVTTAQALPPGGTTDQVLGKTGAGDYEVSWRSAGVGDMLIATYDPQGINADAFARENHTGTQSVTTITGLAAVATSGSYADLSNKPTNLAPRSTSQASTATLTPDADAFDLVAVTAQAAPLTIAAPTGTPLDGQVLTIRIRDNGTSRALTWNGAYSAYTSDLPAATVVSMTMLYRFMYNAATVKWDLFAGNPIPGKWG